MKKIILVLAIILGIGAVSVGSIFVYNKLTKDDEPKVENYESMSDEERQQFAQAVIKDYINSTKPSPTPTEPPTETITYKGRCIYCDKLIELTEENSWKIDGKNYYFCIGTECEDKFNDVASHFYDIYRYEELVELLKEWVNTDKAATVLDNIYRIKMWRNDIDVFVNDKEISAFEHDPLYMALEVAYGEWIRDLDFAVIDAEYEIIVKVAEKRVIKKSVPKKSKYTRVS